MDSELSQPEKKLPKIEFRDSNIHGRGAYAGQYIKRGQYIIEYKGEKISSEEGDKRSEENPEITYVVILNDNYDIDGGVDGSGAQFINHSCDPNAMFKVIDDIIWIIAIKDIKKGEELSWDYEMDADELEPCNCGSVTCKGYMNDAEDIPKLLKRLKKDKE
jgi:uncharacterized protein